MFDYEMLRLIWWALLGVLLIGLALTDGFDLGVAALLPFVAKTDAERRMVINSGELREFGAHIRGGAKPEAGVGLGEHGAVVI